MSDDMARLRNEMARVVGRALDCTRKGSLDGHQMCGEHHYGWLSTGECPTQERVTNALMSLIARMVADAEARGRAAVSAAVEALAEDGFGFGYAEPTRRLRAALTDPAAAVARIKAEAWDEAIQAIAWCLDNGEPSSAAALAHTWENNPYRADRIGGGA